MSTLNKILSKAVSTQSESEAIAALRLARKKYTGGSVSVDEPKSSNTNVLAEFARVKESALQMRDLAEKYRRQAVKQHDIAVQYFAEIQRLRCALQDADVKLAKQEAIKAKPATPSLDVTALAWAWVLGGIMVGSIVAVVM